MEVFTDLQVRIGVFLFLVAEIILGEVGDEETELWAWVLAAGFLFVIILLFIVIA